MLDYEPMEIVAYADEETTPTFDEVYPHLIDNWGINLQDYTNKTFYNWAPTNYKYQSGMDLTEGMPDLIDAPIIGIQMYRYKGTYYNEFETCYYASANDNLYRITQSDVEKLKAQGMQNPWAPPTAPPAFNGENIFEWLYNFGKGLIQDNGLINILSYDIGGYNILSFLTANGFIIVMGWIIIKFVIP